MICSGDSRKEHPEEEVVFLNIIRKPRVLTLMDFYIIFDTLTDSYFEIISRVSFRLSGTRR